MDRERIDFGALDPTRDRAAFGARLDAIVARVQAARPREPSWLELISGLLRPALGLATAAAVALALFGRGEEAVPAAATDPALLLVTPGASLQALSTAELLTALGGPHGDAR